MNVMEQLTILKIFSPKKDALHSDEVVVREHDAFGCARRAAGVGQELKVVFDVVVDTGQVEVGRRADHIIPAHHIHWKLALRIGLERYDYLKIFKISIEDKKIINLP